MRETLELLRQLQSIDSDIHALRIERDELPTSGQTLRKRMEQTKQRQEELEDERHEFQKQLDQKELDLKGFGEKVEKLEEQLKGVKDNREYSVMKAQIEGVKADASVLEDEMLVVMGQMEELPRRQRELQEELDRDGAALEEASRETDEATQSIGNEIAEAMEERKKLTVDVDPEVLSKYERLLNNADGIALAEVENEVCKACFMNLTAQTINRLMVSKELVHCHTCGRILFLPEGAAVDE